MNACTGDGAARACERLNATTRNCFHAHAATCELVCLGVNRGAFDFGARLSSRRAACSVRCERRASAGAGPLAGAGYGSTTSINAMHILNSINHLRQGVGLPPLPPYPHAPAGPPSTQSGSPIPGPPCAESPSSHASSPTSSRWPIRRSPHGPPASLVAASGAHEELLRPGRRG